MMHRFALAFAAALFLGILLAPAPAAAIDAGSVTQDEPVTMTETVAPADAAPGAAPRTLRAYWHLFIAFALAWILLFGYVVYVGRRFARVERELGEIGEAPASLR